MNYNLKRKIESRNKRFAEANDAQKRVMIAKDALAQINEGRFIPKTGSYCRISSTAVKKSLKVGVKDLREAYLGNNINNCKVCGIGALMVASILFNNNVAVDSYIHYTSQGWGSPNDNNNEASNGIRKYFSHEQLRLIEHAFEIEVDWSDYLESWEEMKRRAYKFGRKFRSAKTRLIAILENIISNKGQFIPPEL